MSFHTVWVDSGGSIVVLRTAAIGALPTFITAASGCPLAVKAAIRIRRRLVDMMATSLCSRLAGSCRLIEQSVAVMLAARTDEARRHRLAPDHRTRWRVPQLVSRPILVDLPHPTAGPSEPGKNGNPNSPCNKSNILGKERMAMNSTSLSPGDAPCAMSISPPAGNHKLRERRSGPAPKQNCPDPADGGGRRRET